ncbi:cellulose biosynthesis protein BcsP [Paraburkholderia sp. SOS3]|uniref:cellulose biosynthesis protein BcsP n=1 Tax=Paraburkholderia sp. SOS3 TaxID=1926494 RepID=UPI00094730B4|nr:hypothetical protein BTO02_30035 [Paraburkholderia sp. SOS3]
MSVSDDIGNLFQRFGGNPDRYQEVARDDDAKHAASRWPLLSALDIAQPERVPGAGRPAPAKSAVPAQDVKAATAVSAANATSTAMAAEEDDVTRDPVTSASPRLPLFARSHRHATMPPPVDAARQAASRFSSAPRAAATSGDAQSASDRHAQAAVGLTAAVAPADPSTLPASAASTAPAASASGSRAASDATREISREPDASLFANRKQTFARTPITRDATDVRMPARAEAEPRLQTPAPSPLQSQPHAASPAPRSILSGLFSTPPLQEPVPATQADTRDLATVFARLAAAPRRDNEKPGGQRS